MHNRSRFECKCPDGYTGYRCQQPIKSCRGYSDGNRVARKYKVLDKNKAPYEVFCDFDANSSITWTLIQSYQRSERWKVKPLFRDLPINQDNHSWNATYRLSKSRMESIQNDSTKWRATCQYQEPGCADIVRGSNDKMDILHGDKDGCFEVEYINVRGHSCSNCTVYFRQNGTHQPHLVRLHYHRKQTSDGNQCQFHGQGHANYFGQYSKYHMDTAHCCSESNTSTTQIWFGGD